MYRSKIFTSVLVGGELSAPHSSHFPLGKEPPEPIVYGLLGPQNLSRRRGENSYSYRDSNSDRSVFQSVASRCCHLCSLQIKLYLHRWSPNFLSQWHAETFGWVLRKYLHNLEYLRIYRINGHWWPTRDGHPALGFDQEDVINGYSKHKKKQQKKYYIELQTLKVCFSRRKVGKRVCDLDSSGWRLGPVVGSWGDGKKIRIPWKAGKFLIFWANIKKPSPLKQLDDLIVN
jgi:hypothetical protein